MAQEKRCWVVKWFGPLGKRYPEPPRRRYPSYEEALEALKRYRKRVWSSWGAVASAYHVGVGLEGDPNSWARPML